MRSRLIPTTVAVLCTLLLAGLATAQSLPDWAAYRAITIDNTGSAEALTDYQVKVELTGADFDFTEAQSGGQDVRFTDTDQTALLDHWIETWDAGAEQAVLWVEVPAIAAGATRTIYLYHDNALAASTSDGIATFDFFDSFEDFGGGGCGMNAPTYLATPTYDGSGQVVHPDVLHVPGGFAGWEYWMAMTPYPGGNDFYENPSILVSHDGLAWSVPAGLANPLAPTPEDHNADTDIVLADGVLHVYYMEYTNTQNNVRLFTSTDGVNWTGPVTVFTIPRSEGYCLSPSVVYEAGTFTMWYVRNTGGCSGTTSDLWRRTSTDGVTWDVPVLATIDFPGQVIWHPNVQPTTTGYAMLTANYPVGSGCGNTSLYYAESTDGLTWTVTEPPVLAPCGGNWDSTAIYRAGFTIDGSALRIWYSALGGSSWRVGYTEGDLTDFVSPPTGPQWDEISGNVAATLDHPRTGQYGLREIGGSTYPRVREFVDGRVVMSAWLYDDLSTANNLLALLRAFEVYPNSIGVGLWLGNSATHYSWHRAYSLEYFTSAIPRVAGWHKLELLVDFTNDAVDNDSCTLVLDGQVISVRTELDESNLSMSLEGYQGGTGWFDDAYVRKLTLPEPTAAVGPAIPNVAGEVVLAPAPQGTGPINCSGSLSVDFVLTPAVTSPPIRGFTVEVSATSELAFGTADVTVYDLVPGEPQTAYVTEIVPGTVSVDVALLGNVTGLETAVTAFTVVFHGAATGTGTISMADLRVRDLANNNLPVAFDQTAAIDVDCDLPGPVTDLVGTTGHEHITLTWQDPSDGDLAGLEVWRAMWHDGLGASAYPEYDDLPDDVLPPRPADRAAAAASGDWTLLDTVLPGVQTYDDLVTPRGIYRYEVFPVDLATNAGPRADAAPIRANYYLGDVALPYDGDVDIADITILGDSFGTQDGDGLYNNECDIGPTDDASAGGLPTTDNAVQFEDLIIAAINFGTVAPAPAKRFDGPVALAWFEVSPGVWSLSLTGDADPQGLRLRADVRAADVRSMAPGHGLPWFLADGSRENLDLALVRLGGGGTLPAGTELVRVTLAAGATPGSVSVTARNAANADLVVQLGDQAPVLPVAYAVHPASPNPFNPRTEIAYDLPASQPVRLGVYDVSGRLIRWLVRGDVPAGRHVAVWNGTGSDGRSVPSGIYFYRMEAGPLHETGKMSLVK